MSLPGLSFILITMCLHQYPVLLPKGHNFRYDELLTKLTQQVKVTSLTVVPCKLSFNTTDLRKFQHSAVLKLPLPLPIKI